MAVEQDTILRVLLADRAKLLGYIWSIVRDNHVAEDVFQEVSILAIHKRESIADVKHLPGWFRRAARFKALKALRRSGKQPVMLDGAVLDLLDRQWDQQDDTGTSEVSEALKACVNQLTPNAQQIVSLRYGEGLNSGKVAEVLNRKVETVYKALSRIHNTLGDCVRKRLADEGLTHG